MKKCLVLLLFFLISCSDQGHVNQKENAYKEALLRTRNAFSVDKNIDSNNPLKIQFYLDDDKQLVEVNFKLKRMNSSFITLANSVGQNLRKSSLAAGQIPIGSLKLKLNGVDVTACAIRECNRHNCLGNTEEIQSFSGEISTELVYINLSNMVESEDEACTNVVFNGPDGIQTLIFEHLPILGTGTGTGGGARLLSSVYVYNRPNNPKDIINFLQKAGE